MSRQIRKAFAISSMLLLLSIGCFSARRASPEATQENFGVNMARMNLWREALFRFKRAVQMKPADATAHNNLAVAYEANGDFDSAAKEYREAMRLDKSNQYIQKNYSRFVEFTSRNKKRQQKQTPAPKTASASTTPTPAVPATTTAAPEAPPTSTAPPPTDTAAPPKPPGEPL
ncbi:MAG TPA: tetratricopeptide repeat protein [Thermoanaerobaculia bacterium]|nr:tetratricopeptide repeat protein [Thermoanaerobaculia bacterium]